MLLDKKYNNICFCYAKMLAFLKQIFSAPFESDTLALIGFRVCGCLYTSLQMSNIISISPVGLYLKVLVFYLKTQNTICK